MADFKDPATAPPQHFTPGGIEWETPRPRQFSPSFLRRVFPSAPSSGPSRPVPTTTPAATSTAPAGKPQDSSPTTSSSFLDGVFPPHKTYLSLSRRLFITLLAVISIILLALILGLSIGLTRHRRGHQFLPLPGSSAHYTGDLTYYAPGLGACGVTSSSTDAIVAVAHTVFDAAGGGNPNPNANPLCGRKIRVERDQGGGRGNRSVDVVVVDRCTGCEPTDLDLSPSTFEVLADQALGRVTGSWAWLD